MKSTARAYNIISNANPGPLCEHEGTEDINMASSVGLIFTQFLPRYSLARQSSLATLGSFAPSK